MRLHVYCLLILGMIFQSQSNSFQEIAEMDPAVSPDGTKVAFRAIKDRNSDIYVADIDGGNPERITTWDSSEGGPSWSPDGKTLSFFSNREGSFDIYTIHLKSMESKRITSDSSMNLVAFWLEDPNILYYTSDNEGDEVRSFDLSTGEDKLWNKGFEHHNSISKSPGEDAYWGVIKEGKDWEIVRYFKATMKKEIVASDPARDSDPTPSPDGKRIVFSSKRSEDNWQIFSMDSEGANIRQLTSTEGRSMMPAWLNNDEFIFTSNSRGSFHLYIYSIEKGESERMEIDWQP